MERLNNWRSGTRLWTVLPIVLMSCGSGGASGGNDGSSPSSIKSNPNLKLSTLSPSQQNQLCSEVSAYVASVVLPDQCKSSALVATFQMAMGNGTLTDTDLSASCSTAYTQCVSSGGGSSSVSPGNDDAGAAPDAGQTDGSPACTLSNIPPTCMLTVGDYVACLSSIDDYYKAFPGCTGITRADLGAIAGDGGFGGAASPACTALRTQCTVQAAL